MATLRRTRPSRRIEPGIHLDELLAAPMVRFLVLSWPARLAWICGMGLVIAGFMLGGQLLAGRSLFGGAANGPTNSVTERAQLFTAAWAAHDTAGMQKFVQPGHVARLQHWIAAMSVPAVVSELTPTNRVFKTLSVETDDSDGAMVSVRISSLTSTGSIAKPSELLVQRELWSCTAGSWYFVPEMPESNAPKPPVARIRSDSDDQDFTPEPMAEPARPTHRASNATPYEPPVSRNVIVPSTVPPWQRTR